MWSSQWILNLHFPFLFVNSLDSLTSESVPSHSPNHDKGVYLLPVTLEHFRSARPRAQLLLLAFYTVDVALFKKLHEMHEVRTTTKSLFSQALWNLCHSFHKIFARFSSVEQNTFMQSDHACWYKFCGKKTTHVIISVTSIRFIVTPVRN